MDYDGWTDGNGFSRGAFCFRKKRRALTILAVVASVSRRSGGSFIKAFLRAVAEMLETYSGKTRFLSREIERRVFVRVTDKGLITRGALLMELHENVLCLQDIIPLRCETLSF